MTNIFGEIVNMLYNRFKDVSYFLPERDIKVLEGQKVSCHFLYKSYREKYNFKKISNKILFDFNLNFN